MILRVVLLAQLLACLLACVLLASCTGNDKVEANKNQVIEHESPIRKNREILSFELILDADWVQTIPVGDYRELLVIDSDDPRYGLSTMVAAQKGDIVLFDAVAFRDSRVYTSRIVDTNGNVWNDNVNNLGASIMIGKNTPFEGPASMRVHRVEEEPMRKAED